MKSFNKLAAVILLSLPCAAMADSGQWSLSDIDSKIQQQKQVQADSTVQIPGEAQAKANMIQARESLDKSLSQLNTLLNQTYQYINVLETMNTPTYTGIGPLEASTDGQDTYCANPHWYGLMQPMLKSSLAIGGDGGIFAYTTQTISQAWLTNYMQYQSAAVSNGTSTVTADQLQAQFSKIQAAVKNFTGLMDKIGQDVTTAFAPNSPYTRGPNKNWDVGQGEVMDANTAQFTYTANAPQGMSAVTGVGSNQCPTGGYTGGAPTEIYSDSLSLQKTALSLDATAGGDLQSLLNQFGKPYFTLTDDNNCEYSNPACDLFTQRSAFVSAMIQNLKALYGQMYDVHQQFSDFVGQVDVMTDSALGK